MTDFENMLVTYCSPTLMGAKQASLFSCPHEYMRFIEPYNCMFNKKDIFIRLLYSCKNRLYIIVYRRNLIIKYLADPRVQRFLISRGYPEYSASEEYIDRVMTCLGGRALSCSTFPHEIGFFMGYPVDDVMCFIRHRGLNFKFCGYWKVYGNEAYAIKMFGIYNRCREILSRKTTAGTSLAEFLGAA